MKTRAEISPKDVLGVLVDTHANVRGQVEDIW